MPRKTSCSEESSDLGLSVDELAAHTTQQLDAQRKERAANSLTSTALRKPLSMNWFDFSVKAKVSKCQHWSTVLATHLSQLLQFYRSPK